MGGEARVHMLRRLLSDLQERGTQCVIRSKGYAFVNFTEPAAARAFASIVEGIPMESSTRSAKKMTASPAKLQGMQANLQAISNGYSAEEASWPYVRIGGILEEMQPARALKLLSTSWPA